VQPDAAAVDTLLEEIAELQQGIEPELIRDPPAIPE
jgi:hypothetical protein